MEEVRSDNCFDFCVPVPDTRLDTDYGEEQERSGETMSIFVTHEVERVVEDINTIDSRVIDIIGVQMSEISDMCHHCIKSCELLFESLVRLKEHEVSLVETKKQDTISLLQKIEDTLGFIRKL